MSISKQRAVEQEGGLRAAQQIVIAPSTVTHGATERVQERVRVPGPRTRDGKARTRGAARTAASSCVQPPLRTLAARATRRARAEGRCTRSGSRRSRRRGPADIRDARPGYRSHRRSPRVGPCRRRQLMRRAQAATGWRTDPPPEASQADHDSRRPLDDQASTARNVPAHKIAQHHASQTLGDGLPPAITSSCVCFGAHPDPGFSVCNRWASRGVRSRNCLPSAPSTSRAIPSPPCPGVGCTTITP